MLVMALVGVGPPFIALPFLVESKSKKLWWAVAVWITIWAGPALITLWIRGVLG